MTHGVTPGVPRAPAAAPAPTPAVRRRRLLAFLYGAARAPAVAADLDALLAIAIPSTSTTPLTPTASPTPTASITPPTSFTPPTPTASPPPAAPTGSAAAVFDERAAWVIAYPDHVTSPDRSSLAALDDVIGRHLAPAITGVHTLPVHPSTSDRGFSVTDHASIDPRLGDWDDIGRLAAHRTWMADAVVNHVSVQSTWFRRFLAGDPAFDGFFVRVSDGVDTSAVVRPRTSPLAHDFAVADGRTERVWTTFSADQVDLDFTDPAVLLATVGVLVRYVRHGARAIRLDAIAYVWKDPATASVHLPQTHAIVQLLRACLDEVAPDVVLVTETNVPHAENVSYFGVPLGSAGRHDDDGSASGDHDHDHPHDGEVREADAVYQFALPPLVLHAMLSGTTEPLRRWLTDTPPPPPGRTFLNFLASHDGIGVRPAEGLLDAAGLDLLVRSTAAAGGVVNARTTTGIGGIRGIGGIGGIGGIDAPVEQPYELAVAWFALMGLGVDEDTAVRRHLATHAVALALCGVPLLYLNSLIGRGNDVETFARTGHGRDLNRGGSTVAEIDAELADPSSRAARIWSGLRTMLLARASSPAFHPFAAQSVHDSPDGTVAIERRSATGERALVAVNLTAADHTVAAPGWPEVQLAPWDSRWLIR